MKIISLTAENVKRIKAITIKPKSEIVEVVGKNGMGKSSVLDSIWWALAGQKNIQTVPIRSGETRARIRLDLGELIVERKFTPSGTTLTVEAENGARYPHPQSVLDGLIGSLSFDPLAFSRLKPKDQREQLRGLLTGLEALDTIDPAIRLAYDQRTDINRQVKSAQAAAESVAVDDVRDPGETEADVMAALDQANVEMQASIREDTELTRLKDRVSDEESRLHGMQDRRAQLIKQLEDLDAQIIAQNVKRVAAANAAADAAKQARRTNPDIPAIKARLAAAQAYAKAATQKATREQLREKAEKLEGTSVDLTAKIIQLEADKRKIIEEAKMPIPHLGLSDDGVTYKKIPLDQCSSAEQLRVSVALAMAANPRLRVLRIQDGSLLDADSMTNIEEMAIAGDYQIWVERLQLSGKVGVIIEDGMVKSDATSLADIRETP